MKKFTLLSALFFAISAFSQTPKKELTGEEKKIRAQQYIEYLKKQNRKRDSIYKRGAFREATFQSNNDSDIMKRIIREDELKRAKSDSASNTLIPKK
ncbi:MAG: hypothetical protein ACOH1O_10535 [Flavobacterium sp.]